MKPANTAAPGTSPQIKSNTGLRGIAALAVVGYHLQLAGYTFPVPVIARIFDHSYLMVDLFFMLSGFILSYANATARFADRSGVAKFMESRLIRIYPLHIFCLLYLVIIAGAGDLALVSSGHAPVFADWSVDSLKLLFAQITLTNGWFFTRSGWNTPTWSISVEMISYALFPFLLLSLRKVRIAALVLGVASLSFYFVVGLTSGSLDMIGGWAILRCLAGFGLGMLVFDCRKWLDVSESVASIAQAIALVLIVTVLFARSGDVLIIPGFLLLIASTVYDKGFVSHVVGTKLAQFLGTISYSVYLNHACLLILMTPFWALLQKLATRSVAIPSIAYIPIFFACVVVVSTMTNRWVEVPARQWLNGRLRMRSGVLANVPSAP